MAGRDDNRGAERREERGDEFEGIDISGPWGGVRIGSGRGRAWTEDTMDFDDDAEYRRVRRRVRQRLDFYRHLTMFAFVIGTILLIDLLARGGWPPHRWVGIVALIWGVFLALQFFSNFVSPNLWGRDVEERMVRKEIERRRGRVHVSHPPSATTTPASEPPDSP
jgi:hypothetical protein